MPVLVICETCGTHYNLKDEHLGSRLKCKHCGTVMAVAKAADDVNLQIDRDYDQAFNRDKFFLNQNRISISEKYYVFDENKNPILFILRPAHFLKNVVAALAAVLTMLLIAGGFSALGIYLDNLGYKPVGMITIILGLVVGLALTCIVGVRLSPKRHIYVYSDDTKSRLLLEILQDYKVSFIRAYYTVVDPIDGVIGRF